MPLAITCNSIATQPDGSVHVRFGSLTREFDSTADLLLWVRDDDNAENRDLLERLLLSSALKRANNNLAQARTLAEGATITVDLANALGRIVRLS